MKINKKILLFTVIFLVATGLLFQAYGQMMGNFSSKISIEEIKKQREEEADGKKLFDQLKNKQLKCAKLTDSDFEKIGDYAMGKMFRKNARAHVSMDRWVEQMSGEKGEEAMHVGIGKSTTGCSKESFRNNAFRGGEFSMMGWNGYGMMGNFGFGGFWIVAIVHLVILIDLILLGIWLFKQINKK